MIGFEGGVTGYHKIIIMRSAFVVLLLVGLAQAQTSNLQGNTALPSNFSKIPTTLPALSSCALDCGWGTIDTNGAATLNVLPDVANLNVQVTGRGSTTADAITALSQKITTALKTLTDLGLNSNNWKITSLNVYPNTSYVNDKLVTYGQIASESMLITVPLTKSDGSQVAKIYDGLAQISDITLNGLSFDLTDKTSAYTEARKQAFENAKRRAQDYCDAGKFSLGQVITVVDSYSSSPVVTPINSGAVRAMAMKMEVPTTVSVGTVEINYNVAVVFSFA